MGECWLGGRAGTRHDWHSVLKGDERVREERGKEGGEEKGGKSTVLIFKHGSDSDG
jgi:hypothetical protein